MIFEIRLSNFFSIKDEIVLDMKAGNGKSKNMQKLQANTFAYEDERILKSVAIYGANASGKSNIVKAIRFCASMIFTSHAHNENTVFNFFPFKFEGYAQKPSSFLIRFVLHGVEYEYSFSLTTNEIISEELHYYPNGRRAKIFTRNENEHKSKSEIYSFTSVIRKPMDVAENTSRKTLYISRASQMDRELPKEIFRYFNETFILNYLNYSNQEIEALFLQNKNTLLKALSIADSDIVDINVRKEAHPEKRVFVTVTETENKISSQDITKEHLIFQTFHKANDKIPFDLFADESAGTQKLFFIMLSIIDIVKNNKILLIDEIEGNLHSKIVEYIIGLFHASKSAQIIYTTHNTNLLDLTKLRKDQIYFVNKHDDGSSDLYSLYDYKDFRDTMDVEKAYLQGRFDAIPYIDNSEDTLKQLINE
ncbi:MAG: ATP-binding protein [Bacteroidales bacterium]|nr:ATP-binding protein [Bacteroidales bacterium]